LRLRAGRGAPSAYRCVGGIGVVDGGGIGVVDAGGGGAGSVVEAGGAAWCTT